MSIGSAAVRLVNNISELLYILKIDIFLFVIYFKILFYHTFSPGSVWVQLTEGAVLFSLRVCYLKSLGFFSQFL